ncbi:MAG: hypothetical protein O8C64_15055 [Candidatus Methanoperedens sp.]|nr:hypothetical protein [Candidatus Methanoperedens sp.]MCZ7404193.1 hypothetical protein [Candidatus Methanoperedens sp.]
MKNKGMQLGALLAAMFIVSMAFLPAVSAQVEKQENQLDVSNLQHLSGSDINNLSAKQIESMMTAEQKNLFKELAKKEFSVTQIGADKIVTIPVIDANGTVSSQKIKMTLMSKTTDTELYFVERGAETELVTVQHNGNDVRVTGYAYDKTKAKAEYDVAALRDHGTAKYDVWTENGYLRIWLSPLLAGSGAAAVTAALIYAVGLVLVAIGISISSGGLAVIITFIVLAAYVLYANSDGSLDLWFDLSDLTTYANNLVNWWPYDFGIIDAYAGSNREHYIPIPYGPV